MKWGYLFAVVLTSCFAFHMSARAQTPTMDQLIYAAATESLIERDPTRLKAALFKAGSRALAVAASAEERALVTRDLATLVREADKVKHPSEIGAFLSLPAARKYNIAQFAEVWDPLQQRVDVVQSDLVAERAVTGFADGSNDRIASKFLAEGNQHKEIVQSIFGIPQDATPAFFLQRPEFRDNAIFKKLVNMATAGKTLSEIVTVIAIDSMKEAEGEFTRLYGQMLRVRTASVKSIDDLVAARIRRGSVNWDIKTSTEAIQFSSAALFTFARYINDPNLQRLSQQVGRSVSAAMNVQKAALALASAGTGVGALMATGALLNSLDGLNGGLGDSGQQTAQQFDQLFRYLQAQFEVVNAKLDRILTTLSEMDGKIDRLGIAIGAIAEDIKTIDRKIAALTMQLGEAERSIINNQMLTSVSGCDGRVGNREGFRDSGEFGDCLGRYIFFAERAAVSPAVKEPGPANDEAIRSILIRNISDVVEVSYFANVISDETNKARGQAANLVHANHAMLWKAAHAIERLIHGYPQFFAPNEETKSRLSALFARLSNSERELNKLAGSNASERKQNLIALSRISYKAALDDLNRTFLIHWEAATQEYVRALERRSKNLDIAEAWTAGLPQYQNNPLLIGVCMADGSPARVIKDYPPAYLPDRINWPVAFVKYIPQNPRPHLDICIKQETTQKGAFGLTRVAVAIEVRSNGIVLNTITINKLTAPCLSFIRCYQDRAEIRDDYQNKITEVLNRPHVRDRVLANTLQSVRENNAQWFRSFVSKYFDRYLDETNRRADIEKKLEKLDAVIGLLRGYVILLLPSVWVTEDTVRFFLSDNPESGLIGRSAYTKMRTCSSESLCGGSHFLSGSFQAASSQQYEKWVRLLDVVSWPEHGIFHPHMFASSARLLSVTNRLH